MCITMHGSENVKFTDSVYFKMCLGLPQSARLKLLTHKLHFTWLCIFINYLHIDLIFQTPLVQCYLCQTEIKTFHFYQTAAHSTKRTLEQQMCIFPNIHLPYFIQTRHITLNVISTTQFLAHHVLIMPTFERLM
jgi:hypothetical protein